MIGKKVGVDPRLVYLLFSLGSDVGKRPWGLHKSPTKEERRWKANRGEG